MTYNGGTTPFPVIYYDGKTEKNVGTLNVYLNTNLTTLYSIISQKIGISSHQFIVLLGHPNSDRKIPLTPLNLFTMCRNGGAFYFYIKKSPMKNKNVSEKLKLLLDDEFLKREIQRVENGGSGIKVCKECFLASGIGTVADFHLCFLDEVIVGFKTSAGPISRPAKDFSKNGH